MTPKISIILPIYNVAEYLPQCLDSVIHQIYQNLEIILVNDGSTDSCGEICEDYKLKDSRIKVIHKKNGGLSDARNAGLEAATGEFISFVDSDDLIAPQNIEILLKVLLENKADIAECNFVKFEKENEIAITPAVTSKIEVYPTEAALELLMKEELKQIVWNKLYRKEVIAHQLFLVGKINEDEFWTYKIFGNAKKLVKIPEVLYFYRQQSDSIMGKAYNLRRLDGLEALEEQIGHMKTYFPNLENLAIRNFCLGSAFHYHQIEKNPEIDPQKFYRKKIFNKAKNFNQWSIIKKWYWKDIVWFEIFIFMPKMYIVLREYYERKSHPLKYTPNPVQ